MPILTPSEHLKGAAHMYPQAWKQVDVFRAGRGKDLPRWPAWCFMPMAAWLAIASEGAPCPSFSAATDAAKLAAIGTWRYTQGIYRFDPDTLSALVDSPLNGQIPTEVLYRLPEWCLYIETPGLTWLGQSMGGFWVHLEWDANTQRHEFRLLVNTEGELHATPLHMGPRPVTEAVERYLEEASRQSALAGRVLAVPADAGKLLADEVRPLLSLVLYLCSEMPEIDDERQPGSHPERPRPKKTKGGWRLFPPNKPRVWTVGAETGRQLRQAALPQATEGDGRTVRAHLRKGHWHGFWKGPRDGERTFIYRWLAPMVVGGKVDAEPNA